MWSLHKPTKPERLYVDFDGFFASCEEQADPRLFRAILSESYRFADARQQLCDRGQLEGQEIRRQDRDCDRRGSPSVSPDSARAAAARSVRADTAADRRSGALRFTDRCHLLDRRVCRCSGGPGLSRRDCRTNQAVRTGSCWEAYHLLHRLRTQPVARQDRRRPQ